MCHRGTMWARSPLPICSTPSPQRKVWVCIVAPTSNFHLYLAMEAMRQKAVEMAKKQLDDTVPGIAPFYMKPLFGCCGVYGALKNCMCIAPQSVKDVAEPLVEQIEKNS